MRNWGTSHIRLDRRSSLVALGALGDASAASLGLHCFVLAFLGLEVRTPTLIGIDLVDDPVPEDVRVTPPPAIARPYPAPEPIVEMPRIAPAEPPPREPPPSERESLAFLRSDGLADAADVESAFLSDRDARAIREGRSLATLEAAPPASTPGLLPSPEAGMGPTHSDSKALRLYRDGERDRGQDEPPPGAPAPTTGAPTSGASETQGASERSVEQDALDPLEAAVQHDLAGTTDPSIGDLPTGSGIDSRIASPSETREARDAREQNETDGTNAAPDRSGRGDALAEADVLGQPDESDAPEGGGAGGIGKTGIDSDRSPARDGAPGRHTLPGQPGAPSQLQAAPADLPIDVGAMLSVRGHPLGPWLKLLDAALRERWKPPPDLRMDEATTIVSFTISRQGRVTEIELERGSGRSALDALAIASIPARVPAPSGIEGDRLRVRYSFRTGP
jgi:TonB family protein